MAQNYPSLTGQFTPGGRFVMGSFTQKQDKDMDGRPIPPEDQEFFFGLAVPKNQPGMDELLGTLWNYAAQGYQQNPAVMNQINQGLSARDFSWKVEDGDIAKPDRKTGQMRDIPEYMKGCYIIKFKTKYPFGACDAQGNDINPGDIKIGDYGDVMFAVGINGRVDHNAGIILYPNAIRRLGFGDAISGQQSASSAFANRQAQVPTGASPNPTAGGAVPPAGGMQQNPQQGMHGGMGGSMGGQPQQGMQQPPMGGAPGGLPSAGGAGLPAAGGMQPGNPPSNYGNQQPMSNGGNMATGSPGDPAQQGVQPHNGILQGPQGGGGMPGA